MQRALDIDGHLVHTGATVQVKWLGVWYEGIVVKIGPKKNLCKVRDLDLKESVLSDSKHLQFIESHFLDKHISTGTHVMYRDGENWREGVVESTSAIGVIMVSWRKSGLSEENLTWFESSHVAPVIHNELYNEHNKDILEAGKSGLLHNDAIEPRPRTIENMLYESDSDREEELLTQLAASKSSLEHKHTAKDVTEKLRLVEKKNSTEASTLPTAPLAFPHPVFMPIPPMMPTYGNNMYLPLNHHNYMKMSSSFTSAPRAALPHPRSVKKPGLFQSSVPCVMSLTKPTNGIPPHPSSHFFKRVRNAEITKKKLINPRRAHAAKSRMKKSPTVQSQAHSEPTQYATIEELVDLPEDHNTKISEQEKMHTSKDHKDKPIEAPLQSPQHDHTTKHFSHSLLPHPSLSHLLSSHQSPSKKVPPTKNKSRSETAQPPPLPPRPSKPIIRLITADAPITEAHTSAVSESSLQSRRNYSDSGIEQALTGNVAEQKIVDEKDEGLKLSDHHIMPDQTKRDQGIAVLGLVSTSPTNVTVPHGRSTLLTCVARSSQNVYYEWYRDGKPISENDPFFAQPAPGMLQIKMASLYLSGEYKCVASDGYSSVERVFNLTVCSDTQDSDQGKNGAIPQINNSFSVKQNTQGKAMVEAEVSTPHSQIESEPPVIIVEEFKSETNSPSSPPTLLQSSPDRTRRSNKDDTKEPDDDDIATEQEVAQGRKSAKRNRRRVSSALKNDMEQYLEGYGENYGALSAATHELGSWGDDYLEEEDDDREHKKKNKRRKGKKNKKSTSQEGSSSPTKSNESPKKHDSPKQTKRNVKLPPPLVSKNRKKQVGPEKTEQKPSKAWSEKVKPKSELTNAPPAEVDEEEINRLSVAVRTSVGVSSGSDVSTGEREEGSKLELPQEQESLNDSVRRLQLSVEEYCPEQLQFIEKERKKRFLSNIFSRNKLS